jgi:hypothetical protein
VHWDSRTKIKWTPYIPPCPYWYNVYRKTAAKLSDTDGDGVAEDYGSCQHHDLTIPEADELDDPPPGRLHFYVVAAEGPDGNGSVGPASNGLSREGHYTLCP